MSDIEIQINPPQVINIDLNAGVSDPSKESVTNKSTNPDLGNSNILYPTQNAVKSYVDSADKALNDKTITDKIITTVHFPGYTETLINTTLEKLTLLETDTKTTDLGVLLFYDVPTSGFSLDKWNTIKAFLDVGRVVVVNLEPGISADNGTLTNINAGNFDTAFTQFRNYVDAYALANPSFTKDQLLVKFMHEGNLSVGAYPWVVYDSRNLGSTFNKFTTTTASVITACNNFKTAFVRLSNILGNTNMQRILELGQDSWAGAPQRLDLFFPVSSSYEIVSVNSYNRYGVSSGYGYYASFGTAIQTWLDTCNRVCPEKPKMIGECATTAAGVVNPLGTVATVVSGGSGFPPSVTAQAIPANAIIHNGTIAPELSFTTNGSGVITAIGLIAKGSDITTISIVSSFSGGSGANITVNLRQTGNSKPEWIRQAFEFIKNRTDFRYFGWFLENKAPSPTDNRDWNLNTQDSKNAFNEGWQSLQDRVRTASLGGKAQPNICADPYTRTTANWSSAGSNAGVVDRTTLVTNLPVNDSNVTGCIRLLHTVVSGGRPYDNRLRFFVPFWNGSGVRNGIQPNENIRVEFDALYKTNTNSVLDYTAPLLVAIEDTITGNYERSVPPQQFLTKQHKRYSISTSNGQNSTGGFYVDFMIGSANASGALILTNLLITLGEDRIMLNTKETLALGNVDNTTDLAKPISTLAQTALDLIQNIIRQPVAKITGGAVQFGIPNTNFNSVGTSTLVANEVRYVPFTTLADITITALQLEITSGPAGAGNLVVGIYRADLEMQPTGTKMYDSGNIAVANAEVGLKTLTALTIALTAGTYLVAINTSIAMSLRTLSSPTIVAGAGMGANALVQRVSVAQTFGVLPNTGTLWTATSTSGGGQTNSVIFQWN